MHGNFSFFQGKLYQLRSALFRNFTLCGMVLFAGLLGQPMVTSLRTWSLGLPDPGGWDR